jgi:hypothetical protein
VEGITQTDKNLDITDISGVSICVNGTVKVTKYAEITCMTKSIEIAAGSKIKFKFGTTTIDCSNSDLTKCQYSQVTSAATPSISAV